MLSVPSNGVEKHLFNEVVFESMHISFIFVIIHVYLTSSVNQRAKHLAVDLLITKHSYNISLVFVETTDHTYEYSRKFDIAFALLTQENTG